MIWAISYIFIFLCYCWKLSNKLEDIISKEIYFDQKWAKEEKMEKINEKLKKKCFRVILNYLKKKSWKLTPEAEIFNVTALTQYAS